MNGNKGVFVIENKLITLEALNHVKETIKFVLFNLKQIKDNQKNNSFDNKEACKVSIDKLFFLINTLNKKEDKSHIIKDLDYLYKHCVFAVLRVRDHKDFDFLDGGIEVLDEISEGWDRLSTSVAQSPAAG